MLLRSFEWAHRARYAGVHALLSIGVASLIAALMFFVWYPEPYRSLSGGLQLFVILGRIDASARADVADDVSRMVWAQARRIEAAGTREGLSGTPGYMAPEYIERREIGPRNDVFAAGVLLIELLAGRPLAREVSSRRKSGSVIWAST